MGVRQTKLNCSRFDLNHHLRCSFGSTTKRAVIHDSESGYLGSQVDGAFALDVALLARTWVYFR